MNPYRHSFRDHKFGDRTYHGESSHHLLTDFPAVDPIMVINLTENR